MLTKLQLEDCVPELADFYEIQQGLLKAIQLTQFEQYALAAKELLALLKDSNLPVSVSVTVRKKAAHCLLRGLIAGQFDEQLALTPMSSLTESNWVLDQAEKLLIEVTQLTPDSHCVQIYVHLATIQRMQRRYHQALESLQEALLFAVDSADVHFEYAQTCLILNKMEAAHEHFRLAYEAAPLNVLMMRRYAMSLVQQGSIELAIALMKQAA